MGFDLNAMFFKNLNQSLNFYMFFNMGFNLNAIYFKIFLQRLIVITSFKPVKCPWRGKDLVGIEP